MRLTGKTALIAWASRNIGRAIALAFADGSPLRRVGRPEEVASAALFLASDEMCYVTGDRMICAGGRYM